MSEELGRERLEGGVPEGMEGIMEVRGTQPLEKCPLVGLGSRSRDWDWDPLEDRPRDGLGSRSLDSDRPMYRRSSPAHVHTLYISGKDPRLRMTTLREQQEMWVWL